MRCLNADCWNCSLRVPNPTDLTAQFLVISFELLVKSQVILPLNRFDLSHSFTGLDRYSCQFAPRQ